MTWLAWFAFGLTTGYLVTNHIVLGLLARPLSYYWDQYNGAKGVLLVNENLVIPMPPLYYIANKNPVLFYYWYRQYTWRYINSRSTSFKCAETANGEDTKDCNMLCISAR